MKTLIGAALAVCLCGFGPAMANHGPRDSSVNQRQHLVEQRIEQGMRAGELTRREYRRLQHEAREIGQLEHAFRADGRLSERERGELHARLDRLAREVYREKHDGERRYGSYNRDYHADRR
ncbi:MAG TPA: hypothetical protein VD867_05190 [Burkholderiales bacterium]|nr:hypothetical protein [Burkholderiales bacterium]